MNRASLSARPEPILVEDLVNAGFTTEQVEALKALKLAYPFVEYVDSAKQWRRLQFLKWRYQHGDLQRK